MPPAPHTATMHSSARRGTGATVLLGLLLLLLVMVMMSRSAHAGELLASSQRYPRLGAVARLSRQCFSRGRCQILVLHHRRPQALQELQRCSLSP